MKTVMVSVCTAVLMAASMGAFASTDGQNIDLEYKGNKCEKCWAKLSNSASGTNATASSDTIYFHSDGEAHARAELRFKTFTSGSHSFTGDVQIVSLNGSRIQIIQTFSEASGKPNSQIAIDTDGSFYEVQGGGTCGGLKAKQGSTYPVTVKYDSGSGKVQTTVGGKSCPTVGGSGKLYTKIGAYRTNSGTGSLTTKWSNWTLK
ncbi:MAG: hypothetical protein JWL63_3083 [Rhodocyclales bacterium]|nr:hypothetical protein [Rhodocyclales bacterium]